MAEIVPETIPINGISTDIQTRASLNDTVIDEYAEAYKEGIELPPIEVYFDQEQELYWLSDGFHRLKAIEQLRRDSITAKVHLGSKRDAILNAVGANEEHELRRTNADRRKAVLLLLNDPEWSAPWRHHPVTGTRYAAAELTPRAKRRRRGGRKGALFFLSVGHHLASR